MQIRLCRSVDLLVQTVSLNSTFRCRHLIIQFNVPPCRITENTTTRYVVANIQFRPASAGTLKASSPAAQTTSHSALRQTASKLLQIFVRYLAVRMRRVELAQRQPHRTLSTRSPNHHRHSPRLPKYSS
jgi:hypothetical protein